MTDYEQVYDEAWSGMVGRDRNELHAAGIAAVVSAAKSDALIDAANRGQQEFIDQQAGIGYARVRTDWLRARAAELRANTNETRGE